MIFFFPVLPAFNLPSAVMWNLNVYNCRLLALIYRLIYLLDSAAALMSLDHIIISLLHKVRKFSSLWRRFMLMMINNQCVALEAQFQEFISCDYRVDCCFIKVFVVVYVKGKLIFINYFFFLFRSKSLFVLK